MRFRSLRWRLVIAMALIIAAVLAAAGVFSSITVKREFNRFLVAQRHDDARAAADIMRNAAPGGLRDALKRVHDEFGMRSIVFNDRNEVLDRYPAEMASYDITLSGDVLRLNRRKDGAFESLMLRGRPLPVGDVRVFLLPPRPSAGPDRVFRVTVDRWLIAGIVLAALLAIAVIATLFRRVFAPVEALTAGARALASGRLDARVAVHGRDEIAELAASFNSMAEALERNEKARRNMVSDVAHELRSPLTNIRAQIEAAQDGVVAADGKFLASIEEDAALLARLVEDLQQLTLAEAGQLRLEVEEVEVADLVRRATSGLSFEAITIDVEPGLMIRADARRMVQVLRNLLVNAIAHAKAVDVRASAIGNHVEIRVADDGPGVPPEHAEHIFDRFYRADASRSRTTGGAGLGLAIAKELVELHGGTIRYERPAFVVRLPFIKS